MQSTINFGSSNSNNVDIVHSSLKGSTVKHTTSFFRSDLDWNLLGDTIIDTFQQSQPTIYAGACSDGSEACSLKMLLEKKAPERKFPMIAFDISKEKIAQAQKGIIGLFSSPFCQGDYEKIKKFADENIFNSNLVMIPGSDEWVRSTINPNLQTSYQMTDHLKGNIDFRVGDAIKLSKEKFLDPCVLLFRNVWPYLKTQSVKELSKNLGRNLPPTSIVAIGEYDKNCETAKLLIKRGFQAIEDSAGESYIFKKL